MSTLLQAFGIAILWLGLTACVGEPVDQQARCESLNRQLRQCLGDDLPALRCAGISDADIASLTAALGQTLCESLVDAVPLDGDLRSTYCRLFGEGCIPATHGAPTFRPTRYPLVLVNGIDVSPNFRWSARIVETLGQKGGHQVFLAIDRPYDIPQRRALDLWQRIREVRAETGAERVNLICHSLGGLDCRYLVSPAGLHWEVEASHPEIVEAVASITTVGTAHHGTRVADIVLGYLPTGEAVESLDALASFIGDWFTDEALAQDAHLTEAIASISQSQARAFNAQIVDAEGIYYQSWAGFSRPGGTATAEFDDLLFEHCVADGEEDGLRFFSGSHDYMHVSLGPLSEVTGEDQTGNLLPNDGLVTVEAARWGTFRGCLPADHMEQLGQRNLPDVNVRTGIDIAWFYAEVATDLAARGF